VVEQDGQWRPALDPRAFGVGDPQIATLLAAAPVPVVLARGEHDAMVGAEQLRALVPAPVDLPGLGHNAHVESPAAVAELVLTHQA
jgi:pimeloyl-ACP methyl ester carboxylesterase